MKKAYNQMKLQALAAFEDRGWISPPAWAVLSGYYPVRAAYTYIKRLWTWKLLERRLDRRGLLLYRISERGRGRLDVACHVAGDTICEACWGKHN
jgi:hypothetical protein